MRCDIVEGEPGMFPEPIARVMRKIGGLFGGKRHADRDPGEAAPDDTAWSDLDPTPSDEPPPSDPPATGPPRAEP